MSWLLGQSLCLLSYVLSSHIMGDMKPSRSYLLAVKYNILSPYIIKESFVNVNVSMPNQNTDNCWPKYKTCTTAQHTHNIAETATSTCDMPYRCKRCHKVFATKFFLLKHTGEYGKCVIPSTQPGHTSM